MLALKPKQGLRGYGPKVFEASALSHFGWELTSMLVTWVDRWSMSSIVGTKVLDPNLRSLG